MAGETTPDHRPGARGRWRQGARLAGALQPFGDAGYTFARVGGTSAGALVGAVLAALQQRGEPVSRLEDVARTLDFSKFPDRGFPGRLLGPLGFLADGVSVLLEDGAYEGDYLRRWLSGVLRDLGVGTFGDLRTDDPGDDGSLHHRYRLTVTATDVSRKRLVYLPWQYDEYDSDPDDQPSSTPCGRPRRSRSSSSRCRCPDRTARSTLVDGGLVSNYPISMFDRTDGRPARWPTIGVRLGAFGIGRRRRASGSAAPCRLGVAAGADRHRGLPGRARPGALQRVAQRGGRHRRRSAPSTSTSPASSRAPRPAAGRTAGTAFLATWDYDDWLADCRPPTAGPVSPPSALRPAPGPGRTALRDRDVEVAARGLRQEARAAPG